MKTLALLLLIGAIAVGVLSATDVDSNHKDKQVSHEKVEKKNPSSDSKLDYERKW